VPAANGKWATAKPKCASLIHVDRDFRVNRKLRETREANQSVLQRKIEHGKHKKASKEALA
jgi:hypothetical protein